jgi:hypothetical protein
MMPNPKLGIADQIALPPAISFSWMLASAMVCANCCVSRRPNFLAQRHGIPDVARASQRLSCPSGKHCLRQEYRGSLIPHQGNRRYAAPEVGSASIERTENRRRFELRRLCLADARQRSNPSLEIVVGQRRIVIWRREQRRRIARIECECRRLGAIQLVEILTIFPA